MGKDNFDDFAREVLRIAKGSIDETLMLPGIWEIISEHYNNEAIENLEARDREARREHLMAKITSMNNYGYITRR